MTNKRICEYLECQEKAVDKFELVPDLWLFLCEECASKLNLTKESVDD